MKPHLRFKNFHGSWQKSTLYSITSIKSSDRKASDYEKYYDSGEYPVFDVKGEIANVKDYDSDKPYIAIVKDGSVGKIFLCPEKSSVISTINYLYNKENIDILFLYHLIAHQISWEKYIVGTSIPHIYYKDYSLEQVYVPKYNEQKKIGQFFKELDSY
ncbi:restriction endonuclease subunit S [Psittacicella gerlachiana]|uniref:Type I restriction modification DNA specificity domain-containing protein n=1 Tax=Psittacicella gerlachiana TaxID=2028574 RepID=A0A3A1Y3D5_9GAMM|nr:restriction endonuclease subunit S [Psittacicella gerlachiana]RIY31756.1 hypothetical protein CKF59_07435 [Psittacicella gerlachiana]